MSDYKGARALIDQFPASKHLLADHGYDADWFRNDLRHKIENMFGKFKDWRRIATRYDRCAHTFFSAICIAAFVIWWI